MEIAGFHDSSLVWLSIIIAIFASFTALSLATRIRAASGWMRAIWHGAAAVALGGGIWSMHFVAMLAFSMPGMSMSYDPLLTLLSFALAVVFTGAGFAALRGHKRSSARIGLSGLMMGFGVVAMHYVGMAAMQMEASLRYDRIWLAISVLIAIGAASAAVWLASLDHKLSHRLAAALAMGGAIAGMHYAGMRAAIYTAASHVDLASGTASLSQTYLALAISAVTVLILVLSLIAARLETSFQAYERRERRRSAELKQAEQARREADVLYRAYFENAPDPLFVIGVNSNDTFVVEEINPAHEASTGFKRQEIRGKRVEEILGPENLELVLKAYRRVLSSGELYHFREVFALSSGPQHWDTTLVPVRDAEGAITRLIGTSRDVTAQIQAEEVLRQSQKMEAMGSLTGGVAHDFNNLLTPIMGSLDLLNRKAVGDAREHRLIAGALQSAEKAKTLVQRLLAFARRQPLKAVAVNVVTLVKDMLDLISSTTGPKIKVTVDAQEGLPPACADPNQLEMALLNLCVNARDAMPEGGTLTISLSTEKTVADHRSGLPAAEYIRLSVADTGTGMDEQTLSRAVEPFFSTKGVGKGTGLGLSMVHGLAAQLGGAVTIQSKPGLGTNVELWLPVSNDDAQRREASGHQEPPAPAQGKVMLVDDEDLARASTADMLVDLGFEVVEVTSAEEALREIRNGASFDLLVTDHLMPGKNGSELALEVRAERPNVPVLVISGYAQAVGAPDLPRLAKPFRQSELAAKLGELVKPAATEA